MSAAAISRALAGVIAVALAACSRAREEPAAGPPYSVLLITLDTTRSDALGSYGGTHAPTPTLDRLAAESVRYTQARTVTPLTLPAHASMLTGLYPPRHTVRANGPAMLPAEATTLAELARAAGFQTAGFVGGLTLDRAYGAAQGFERWTQPVRTLDRAVGEVGDRRASEVVADARAWLAGRDASKRFFLWVHLFDAHSPYAPPPAFSASHPYYAEVASADAALAGLVEDLERGELLASTLVCVLADHGEALGEHGEETHGLHAWDATVRVPFFVRHPDGWRAGQASDEPVSVADVMPTLLEAMALEVPPDLDGVSLFRRAVPAERGVYFETLSGWARFGWSPLAGWADAHGKYVHGSVPRFFRVREDQDEREDELASLGADVARYRDAIARVIASPKVATGKPRLASADASAALAALGYAGSDALDPEWPDPLAAGDRPDPAAMLDEYREFTRAQTLVQARRAQDAIPILERIVAANGANLHALDELGRALSDAARWEEAARVLEDRARRPPARVSTHQLLVRCYLELGDQAKADAHTLRALEILIETHERRGEPEVAARYRKVYEEGARDRSR